MPFQYRFHLTSGANFVEVHIGGLAHPWHANALNKKGGRYAAGEVTGLTFVRGRKIIEAESPHLLQGRVRNLALGRRSTWGRRVLLASFFVRYVGGLTHAALASQRVCQYVPQQNSGRACDPPDPHCFFFFFWRKSSKLLNTKLAPCP